MNPNLRRLAPKSAFTLIEVVVAVAVFALMAAYGHQAFGLCLKAVQWSDRAMASASLLERSALDLKIRFWDPGTNLEPTWNQPGTTVSKSDFSVAESVFDYYQVEAAGQTVGLLVEKQTTGVGDP